MKDHRERQGFLLYNDDMKAVLQFLSMEERGVLLTALYQVSCDEQVDLDMPPHVGMAFQMLQSKIQRDKERYEEKCRKSSAAAKARHAKQQTADAENAVHAHANAENAVRKLPTKTETVTETKTETVTETETETETEAVSVTVTPAEKACAPAGGKENTQHKAAEGASRFQGEKEFVPPTPQQVEDYAREQGAVIDGQRFCDYNQSRGWRVGHAMARDWRALVRNWISREGQYASGPPGRSSRQVSAQMYSQRQYTEEELGGEALRALLQEAQAQAGPASNFAGSG